MGSWHLSDKCGGGLRLGFCKVQSGSYSAERSCAECTVVAQKYRVVYHTFYFKCNNEIY